LPPDYKEVYTAQRIAKNQRVATTLKRLGFAEVAANIFAHPTQYIETDFNATKTWIEYINRLVGVLIGMFIFATLVVAWPYRRRDPVIFWLAALSFVTVGVQGWLGSLVVSTNLLPVMVTIHMALTLVLVGMLIWAMVRSEAKEHYIDKHLSPGLTLGLAGLTLLTFLQIVVGTQVRENVDMVAFGLNYLHREQWVEQLGGVFRFHKAFSAVLVLANAYVVLLLFKTELPVLRKIGVATMVIIAAEALVGIVLAEADMPAAGQPIHLTLGTLLFGVQFLMLVRYRKVVEAGRTAAHPVLVA
jgi:cytochrome c oxidase assembly protein subunit 15